MVSVVTVVAVVAVATVVSVVSVATALPEPTACLRATLVSSAVPAAMVVTVVWVVPAERRAQE